MNKISNNPRFIKLFPMPLSKYNKLNDHQLDDQNQNIKDTVLISNSQEQESEKGVPLEHIRNMYKEVETLLAKQMQMKNNDKEKAEKITGEKIDEISFDECLKASEQALQTMREVPKNINKVDTEKITGEKIDEISFDACIMADRQVAHEIYDGLKDSPMFGVKTGESLNTLHMNKVDTKTITGKQIDGISFYDENDVWIIAK
ncbi:MAG: hypothetical protein ABRQ38_15580 [Candidatus Eremiobacterota bacterium]